MSTSVAVAPLTKLLPKMVRVCAVADPVTGFGLTLLIDGAGPTPADTVKVKALDESPSGLVTCTLQVEAVVVKLALRVSWPLLMKLVVLGKVPP